MCRRAPSPGGICFKRLSFYLYFSLSRLRGFWPTRYCALSSGLTGIIAFRRLSSIYRFLCQVPGGPDLLRGYTFLCQNPGGFGQQGIALSSGLTGIIAFRRLSSIYRFLCQVPGGPDLRGYTFLCQDPGGFDLQVVVFQEVFCRSIILAFRGIWLEGLWDMGHLVWRRQVRFRL
jgi:hypothetical protein